VTEKGINNQPKNQVNIPSFKIEQSQKADFTANSGMFLVAELIKKLDVIEKLAQLNIFHRNWIYHHFSENSHIERAFVSIVEVIFW